ncbi:hypothetical protein ACFE04_015050 [Oxalis oulophora]
MVVTVNTYEEARNETINQNLKKLEEIGLLKAVKNLAELAKPAKKPKQRVQKPKEIVEPRRSSRERKEVSYRDVVDFGMPLERKRKRSYSSIGLGSYLGRPEEECILCSKEERDQTELEAERQLSKMKLTNPAFIKSMVRSHVYSCFWMGLPKSFKNYLKSSGRDMILENETGEEFPAVYLADKVGLSGGWRGFALAHDLHDGDALIFELVKPVRFKIYIFRVTPLEEVKPENADYIEGKSDTENPSQKPKVQRKAQVNMPDANDSEGISDTAKPKVQRKGKLSVANVDHFEAAQKAEVHKPTQREERLLKRRMEYIEDGMAGW